MHRARGEVRAVGSLGIALSRWIEVIKWLRERGCSEGDEAREHQISPGGSCERACGTADADESGLATWRALADADDSLMTRGRRWIFQQIIIFYKK